MKKLFFLTAFAVILLALTACAYDGRTTPQEADLGETIHFYGVEKTTQPVELLIWLDNEEWAMAMIRAFVNKYPNVTVLFEQMGNVESRAHMQLDGPSGHGADIFAFPHDQVSWAISDGMIEPVPMELQAKWQSELVPAAVETVTHNGRMHAVPFQVENLALFYNRDLWGPTPPRTFEEIFEFARSHNNPATNDWTMVWNMDPYHVFPWFSIAGWQLFGPNMNDYTLVGFESPELTRGIETFLTMRGLFDLPIEDINFNTGEERFRLGEIPLTITGPWAINDLKENGVNFGVTQIPTIGGVQPISFSGNINAGVSSFASPTNRAWAYAFLDFMVSVEGAVILHRYMNQMTSRLDREQIPGLRDDPHLLGLAEQTPFTVPMPTISQINQVWGPWGDIINFTWNNELTVQQAQERAMESYRMLLNIAGHDNTF
ncbi:MAG: extracellular solute-binding protein [Defluviitaleaceae bacterium]|nr:extracellular solute-binding protein [Defluviitaleaceae bacterium]